MNKPTVAIVGRPNTGKSTLFNRILGGRPAIVSDRPGTTRDRHFGDAEWQGRSFWLVDTGGLVPESEDSMDRAIRQQVEFALAEKGPLPRLIELGDIQGDLHMHTTASDGSASILEMAEAAKSRGRKYNVWSPSQYHAPTTGLEVRICSERSTALLSVIGVLNVRMIGIPTP